MRRTYSIMKWACAVVLITGMGLTTAHGAAIVFKSPYRCWVIDAQHGTHCTDLGWYQCQIQDAGSSCTWCQNTNGVLYPKTCVPYNGAINQCGTDGQNINCGNSFKESCQGNQ